jgi:hypothetical protein
METKCDLCQRDVRELRGVTIQNLIIDGRTLSGWAYMCVPCHKKHGLGLGIGNGQMYEVINGSKLAG